MKQRIFALLLAAALCLSLVPAAFAADGASGTCGTGLTWALDEFGVLTVSGKGKMDFSEQPWAEQQNKITALVIQEGVTSICDGAFTDCAALTSVTLPDTLTEIGDWAFSACAALREFSVGKNLTSIGYGAFAFCKSLEAFHADTQNTAYYSDEKGVLYDKEKTVLICAPAKLAGDYTVPEGTQKLDYAAFAYCADMEGVNLPASLTSILSEAFTGCDSLLGIWVAEGNKMYSSDERGVLFLKNTKELYCCPGGLTGSYTVPDGTLNIKGQAFSDCRKLQIVNVPASVEAVGGKAFYNCTALMAVCFLGNEPICLSKHSPFLRYDPMTGEDTPLPGTVVYHLADASGWKGETWKGCPLRDWDGVPFCLHEHTKIEKKDSSCTERGYEYIICCDCGEKVAGADWPADGHKFKNGYCTACFAEDPENAWVNPFRDVRESDWFYDDVKFANRNGLFNGTETDTFSPEGSMTRAMLVTVLWRLEGSPEPVLGSSFADVPEIAYYRRAVAWAAEHHIVNGYDSAHFGPDDAVTREQIATILFRYAEKKNVSTAERGDLSVFPDANRVSGYAQDALAWANAAGLVNGTKEGNQILLDPQGSATRAQVAAILTRYIQKVQG